MKSPETGPHPGAEQEQRKIDKNKEQESNESFWKSKKFKAIVAGISLIVAGEQIMEATSPREFSFGKSKGESIAFEISKSEIKQARVYEFLDGLGQLKDSWKYTEEENSGHNERRARVLFDVYAMSMAGGEVPTQKQERRYIDEIIDYSMGYAKERLGASNNEEAKQKINENPGLRCLSTIFDSIEANG
ncbi:hypothetical protein ACFL2D_00645 [Patescibacteria group bacterium]